MKVVGPNSIASLQTEYGARQGMYNMLHAKLFIYTNLRDIKLSVNCYKIFCRVLYKCRALDTIRIILIII